MKLFASYISPLTALFFASTVSAAQPSLSGGYKEKDEQQFVHTEVVDADYEIRLDATKKEKIVELLASDHACMTGIRSNPQVSKQLLLQVPIQSVEVSKLIELIKGPPAAPYSVFTRKIRISFENSDSLIFNCNFVPSVVQVFKGFEKDPLKELFRKLAL